MKKYLVTFITLVAMTVGAAPKAKIVSKDARMPSQVTGNVGKLSHSVGYT